MKIYLNLIFEGRHILAHSSAGIEGSELILLRSFDVPVVVGQILTVRLSLFIVLANSLSEHIAANWASVTNMFNFLL